MLCSSLRRKSESSGFGNPKIKDLALILTIVFSYGILALLPDLRLNVPEMIGLTAWLTILLAIVAFRCRDRRLFSSVWIILGTAALLRLIFLPRMPELSDDIYRYVLDGLMTLSGHNPYSLPPAAVPAEYPEMARIAAAVNHPEYVTLYPPAAQAVFAMGAFFGGVTGMKILLVLFDLGTCAIIIRLLDAIGRPRGLAVLYAWHPLAVIEIAGSGHIDAAGIFFLFAAILLLIRLTGAFRSNPIPEEKNPGDPDIDSPLNGGIRCYAKNFPKRKIAHRSLYSPLEGGKGGVPPKAVLTFAAGALTSAAILVKLFPILFLPGLIYFTKTHYKWFTAGLFLAGAALILPFHPDLMNGVGALSVYMRQWEFSGFAFRMLRRLTTLDDQLNRLVLASVFMVAAAVIYGRMLLENHRRGENGNAVFSSMFNAFYGIAFAYLLLTPTLHPWYALYLAAFLPFAGGPAGVAFTWAVLLAYRVQIHNALTWQWIESDQIAFLIVSAPAAAVTAGMIRKIVSRQKTFFHAKAQRSQKRLCS